MTWCGRGLVRSVSQVDPAEHSDDGEWPRPLYLKQVAGGGRSFAPPCDVLGRRGPGMARGRKARSKRAEESCYAPAEKKLEHASRRTGPYAEREARHGGSISCNPGLCGLCVCVCMADADALLMALTNDVDGIRNPILFSSQLIPALRGHSGMWMWAHGATRAPGEGKGKGGRLRCAGGGARQLLRVALGLSVHLRYGQARLREGRSVGFSANCQCREGRPGAACGRLSLAGGA
jgi:hypothetical protein